MRVCRIYCLACRAAVAYRGGGTVYGDQCGCSTVRAVEDFARWVAVGVDTDGDCGMPRADHHFIDSGRLTTCVSHLERTSQKGQYGQQGVDMAQKTAHAGYLGTA